MKQYIVIEVADGLEAVELPAGQKPEDVAIAEGGVLVDEGPFASLEEANDAIDYLESTNEPDAPA